MCNLLHPSALRGGSYESADSLSHTAVHAAGGFHPARSGTVPFRMFAVGQASISVNGNTYSGTGNLTLQDVYIKNFKVKGGDGADGGGGGLGAGGAIYVGKVSSGVPALTIQNSTFDGNA